MTVSRFGEHFLYLFLFNPQFITDWYFGRIQNHVLSHHTCRLSHFSRVWFFATQWTIDHQAPLSMGFSRQEYWSRLLWPPPGGLPNPGIKRVSLMHLLCWQAGSLPLVPSGKPRSIHVSLQMTQFLGSHKLSFNFQKRCPSTHGGPNI